MDSSPRNHESGSPRSPNPAHRPLSRLPWTCRLAAQSRRRAKEIVAKPIDDGNDVLSLESLGRRTPSLTHTLHSRTFPPVSPAHSWAEARPVRSS